MTTKALPCPTLLRQLLRYEPETGKLFWKKRPRWMFTSNRGFSVWNARYSNGEAFTASTTGGYKVGAVNYTLMKAHRVIWAICNGAWPEGVIDHINGNTSDNRLENIRDVTQSENMKNIKTLVTNTSGFRGVCWQAASGKWMAYIDAGKRYHIGLFAEKAHAIDARNRAEAHHGFHENHGR